MGKTYRVKRALIMAAGVGKRLHPVTLSVPKPLVKVNGERMIETVIRALLANGINEIYIVVGYKKEQFSILTDKYPNITLIENPRYKECNNISSLYVARELLTDSIILDGDQIIYDPRILVPEFTRSGYNAAWCEGETTEWLLDADESGKILGCSRSGGRHGWQLYSVSRWNYEDGKKLACHVEREFEAGNRGIYWDDVPLFCYPGEYELGIFPMKQDAIIEVDNYAELVSIDPSYAHAERNNYEEKSSGSEKD